tara:strand:- start:640 stop:975 length:336 start_codon:yes stop_codon:yes gene_type:complete
MVNKSLEQVSKFLITVTRELGTIKRALRRKYLIYFRPKYVEGQMRKRKGVCGRHGCCDLSIFHKYRKCLSSSDRTKCLYWDNLPKECKLYPIDEEDKVPETRSYCNFYWKD